VFPAERKIFRHAKEKETLSVEEFSIMQRHYWIYSFYFRHGNLHVQQSVIMLWSSITGTRPGVLLPKVDSSIIKPTDSAEFVSDLSAEGQDPPVPFTLPSGRKRDKSFKSDLPKYVPINDKLKTICWRDIELFYIRNLDRDRDVLCAIINFTNLKGRPERADK
jgi:hypothetical protein